VRAQHKEIKERSSKAKRKKKRRRRRHSYKGKGKRTNEQTEDEMMSQKTRQTNRE
jgi:hypothetical protein